MSIDGRPTLTGGPNVTGDLDVIGDFADLGCALASRRLDVLALLGVDSRWHAVTRHPLGEPAASTSPPGPTFGTSGDLGPLLPGEAIPTSPPGRSTNSVAATSGYAEATAAGVASAARRALFRAWWVEQRDMTRPDAVRSVLGDLARRGHSRAEAVAQWGHVVSVAGGPVSTDAWQLTQDWQAQWHEAGRPDLPFVRDSSGTGYAGVEALRWLADQVTRLGAAPARPDPIGAPDRAPDSHLSHVGSVLSDISWISQNGGQWLRDYRDSRHAGRSRRVAAAVVS